MPGGIYLRFEVDEDSLKRLNRALKALAETDAPYLRAAMGDIGQRVVSEARSRGPGSIGAAVEYRGLGRSKTNIRANGLVAHAGGKAMEFGRQYFYRGFTRGGKGSQKKGQRFKSSPGMPAKPYIGVVTGEQAMGATRSFARQRLLEAIDAEWNRIGEGD